MILRHIYMSKTHKIVNPALLLVTFYTIRFIFYTKTLNIYLFFFQFGAIVSGIYFFFFFLLLPDIFLLCMYNYSVMFYD